MRKVLLVAVGLGALLASGAAAAMTRREDEMGAKGKYDHLYQKHGAAFGVDWRLLKAVALTESSENAAAVNAADRESIGLMQILCQPDGKGGCRNKLNVAGWPETTRGRLLDPDWNVYIGAQILAWNLKTFGMPRGIAVYNAWDQRNAPANGPFKNQGYVDKVLRRARALGWQS